MQQHPWVELQDIIREKWLTQREFSVILWKKISEVNELLKWKRNITIQRDFLLHQAIWTPIKYRILKQIDYEYSLILPSLTEWNEIKNTTTQQNKQEHVNKEYLQNNQEETIENKEIDNNRAERAQIFRSF